MDMNKEILNIEDDDAYVEISNFIPLLDGPLHNEIYLFLRHGLPCIYIFYHKVFSFS
jgi:hypothetical protein